MGISDPRHRRDAHTYRANVLDTINTEKYSDTSNTEHNRPRQVQLDEPTISWRTVVREVRTPYPTVQSRHAI